MTAVVVRRLLTIIRFARCCALLRRTVLGTLFVFRVMSCQGVTARAGIRGRAETVQGALQTSIPPKTAENALTGSAATRTARGSAQFRRIAVGMRLLYRGRRAIAPAHAGISGLTQRVLLAPQFSQQAPTVQPAPMGLKPIRFATASAPLITAPTTRRV